MAETIETITEVDKVETQQFQAETKQLLDLMIHSLYSNKEIFLRELISNASDALDRLRFEALTRPELLDGQGEEELKIRLEADRDKRTLTIHDNGIGMSRDEVIDNIGTIAKSGTRELVERLKAGESKQTIAELIGQFGVGFYSSFMAAERVELVTRRAGEEQATRWESTGDGTYQIADGAKASRGTSITLHLKPEDRENGMDDFSDRWVVSRIVRRYSDFVGYPIVLKAEKDPEIEDLAKEKETGEKPKMPMEEKTLNSMKPIWTMPQSEVTAEQYNDFYRHVSHDWTEPLKVIPYKAEGRIEYQALLFIPAAAPYDLYYVASKPGLQLYVKRVQIMETCEDLLPQYLRFVRGVVDSPDLALNVSREMLQQDRFIALIRKGLTKKMLDVFDEMKEKEPEKYLAFWKEFGRAIKEGTSADYENKERLLELLLFPSSNDPEKLTTLERLRRPHEGGADRDLLPARRVARPGRDLAPPRGDQGQGLRGALPGRHRRRAADPIAQRVPGQAPQVGRQGHGQPRRRGGEEADRGGAQGQGRGVQAAPRVRSRSGSTSTSSRCASPTA